MSKPKLIVIWGREDILSTSIELFLAAKADWKVVSIANKDDLDALIPLMEKAQADVVLITLRSDSGPSKFQLDFIRSQPTLKVITINLENNALEVYSKQNIMLRQASDLMTLIENEP